MSVKGTDFRVEKIALTTVRPYIFSTIDLADSGIQPELEDDVMSYVSDRVSMGSGSHGDGSYGDGVNAVGEGAYC